MSKQADPKRALSSGQGGVFSYPSGAGRKTLLLSLRRRALAPLAWLRALRRAGAVAPAGPQSGPVPLISRTPCAAGRMLGARSAGPPVLPLRPWGRRGPGRGGGRRSISAMIFISLRRRALAPLAWLRAFGAPARSRRPGRFAARSALQSHSVCRRAVLFISLRRRALAPLAWLTRLAARRRGRAGRAALRPGPPYSHTPCAAGRSLRAHPRDACAPRGAPARSSHSLPLGAYHWARASIGQMSTRVSPRTQ